MIACFLIINPLQDQAMLLLAELQHFHLQTNNLYILFIITCTISYPAIAEILQFCVWGNQHAFFMLTTIKIKCKLLPEEVKH